MLEAALKELPESTPSACNEEHPLHDLRHGIEHAAHLLPAQGPIEVFVHHNTLHAFEDLSFHEAVKEGLRIYGAQPYLPEVRYREMLLSGRIEVADLETALRDDLGGRSDDLVSGLATLHDLRMSMLRHPLQGGSDAELRWLVAETDALERFRDDVPFLVRERMLDRTREWLTDSGSLTGGDVREDLIQKFGRRMQDMPNWDETRWESALLLSLWRICRSGVQSVPVSAPELPGGSHASRPRDILLRATGDDPDRYVHEFLIRFCGAFLDQGYADWNLPDRDHGLFRAFVSVYRQSRGPVDRWLRNLSAELKALWQSTATPEQSILSSLELLGISAEQRDEFIEQTLLALGGWAGMMWQMESAADWTVRPAPKGSLLEFLAVRLILDHQAILYFGEEYLGCNSSAHEVLDRARQRVSPHEATSVDRRAFLVFQLAQIMGWHPQQLLLLSNKEWASLVRNIEEFTTVERRRVFHEAFERQYREQALSAFAVHSGRRREQVRQSASESSTSKNSRDSEPSDHGKPTDQEQTASSAKSRPAWQIVCCIDDREESFRRHLEEIDPSVETFGAAGFFAVVMYYRGAADAYFKPLCPGIVTPEHYVTEDVGYTFEGVNRQRASSRKRIGRITHQVHQRSRTFVGGILTGLFGSLATFPLVARVLFPRLTSQIRKRFGELLQPPPVTQLQLERYEASPGSSNGHVGYTLAEMAGIVQRLLQDIGLTKTEDFSRVVIICGHGSSSINNPHESAYCCGACAGKRGGPNARAFAHMANDFRVRNELQKRGLTIPEETTFLGAYHDTTSDSVVFYDLDRMPASHRTEFERIQKVIEECRERNAHERCRRFVAADLKLPQLEMLRHAETRGEDLSQVRPEYNHATDSMCIVGRRDWSRGLFLDRRAFLTSYDPTQDDADNSVLFRILAAAIPVCAGINLEYYFSTVDNTRYGSGSKLPHNLVSLLGVMEGACSDLRTGLYAQMVEIHEPMRLLFLIETTPEAMLSIIRRHEGIARLCLGGWVQLALIDADTSEIQLFRNGRFEPFDVSVADLPEVASSRDWYAEKRGNLGFASIDS
ncbi:DUF2309 family protein [bacterium]|nr:DUF2309 family protein [bacterium]